MTRQEGIEPPTHSLEGCCSIQLSYWRFIHQWRLEVGAPGFEPGTSCSQSRRDTRLRYAPRAFECIRPSGQNQLLQFAEFRRSTAPPPAHHPPPKSSLVRAERAKRPAAMAHPLLLRTVDLAKRPAELVGHRSTDRTRTRRAARVVDDRPMHRAATHELSRTVDERRGADIVRSSIRHPRSRSSSNRLFSSSSAWPERSARPLHRLLRHPGRAAKRDDDEPGIIRERSTDRSTP